MNQKHDGDSFSIRRFVNQVSVEQRVQDGFINGTAMCTAHGKDISDWLALDPTLRLVAALAKRLNIKFNSGISPNSVKTRVSSTFPKLVIVKRGSPSNGGGTWIHPKLAVHLAQWCSPEFALLVSDWVEEWLTTGKNPVAVDPDKEWAAWQQRYDIRIHLKDILRIELMNCVARWAEEHGRNPRNLCSDVHDTMNERIQGAKSQDLKLMGGLPLAVLIRDHLEATPLVTYSAINKLAKNSIEDKGVEPIQAIHDACDAYLGKAYEPKPLKIVENVYSQGHRIAGKRRKKRLAEGIQGNLLDMLDSGDKAS